MTSILLKSFQSIFKCSTKSSHIFNKLGTNNLNSPSCSLAFNSLCRFSSAISEKRGRKGFLDRADAEKTDTAADELPGEVDLAGLTSGGITIPTLQTMEMLVDGVPYNRLPIVFIKATPNNTMMTCFDHTGLVKIAHSSCGLEGFKNAKKSTNVAAQATGLALGLRAKKQGVKSLRVVVKGIGTGRLPAMKGLQMAGINIISMTDETRVSLTLKPRKKRRL